MSERRRWVLLLALIAVATAGHGQQSKVRFQRLEVAIWPEYDQPAALVMYRGWLAADVALPTTVTLPMPAEVSTPNAVAKRGPATGLLVAPYTIEEAGDWNLVHLQTDLPEVRLEFYLDLPTDQPRREFRFEWPGGLDIANVAYEVMQPLGALDFLVTPSSGPPGAGVDGLIYQREELGPISAGGTFLIDVSYTKSTPNLTASALQPASPPPQQNPPPVAPPPVDSTQQTEPSADNSVWFVVLPIVFVAGLAAGWILLSTRKERSP